MIPAELFEAYNADLEQHEDVTRVIHRKAEAEQEETVVTAAVDDEPEANIEQVEVRGVKAGLRNNRKKLKFKDFHKRYSHMGSDPSCKICKMVRGCMRRIYKKIDPYKEARVGHTWGMDICTMSHRSESGCRYVIVLRDYASGVFKFLPIARRTSLAVTEEIEKWVKSLRNDPIYCDLPYQMVSVIRTDNEGAWRIDTEMFQEMANTVGINMIYCEPGRHAEENGYAESAVQIMEHCVKKILIAGNLPQSWWQAALADAEFLLNRFPVTTDTCNIPIDGDRARPLEVLTRGFYSRRQIDRELGYYVSVGTPCLVHDPEVKGSSVQPKVRWGIAKGMYREQVWFMDPYSKSKFKSKSYSAYTLRDGSIWSVFLGLGEIQSTRKQMALPEDQHQPMGILIELPEHLLNVDWRYNKPKVVDDRDTKEKKESVTIVDEVGRQLLSDMDNGYQTLLPSRRWIGNSTERLHDY